MGIPVKKPDILPVYIWICLKETSYNSDEIYLLAEHDMVRKGLFDLFIEKKTDLRAPFFAHITRIWEREHALEALDIFKDHISPKDMILWRDILDKKQKVNKMKVRTITVMFLDYVPIGE